ncbi:MAG: hypothetical protein ACNA7G_14410 [Methylobacter sp.]
MNFHFKNWLDGISQALILYPEQDYLRPQRGDFQNDAAALRGDVAKITQGLHKSLADNGKINTRIR